MASFIFNIAKEKFALGEIDWVDDDIRIGLVVDATVTATHEDMATVTAFLNTGASGVEEYTGTNYAAGGAGSGRKALTSTVDPDAANNRAELKAGNITYTALGLDDGSKSAKGLFVYKHVGTDDANNIPIAHIDGGGFPFFGNGSDVTVSWNAEGIVQLA